MLLDVFLELNDVLTYYVGPDIASYIVAIFIIADFLIVAHIINFLFKKIFDMTASRTKTDVDNKLVKMLSMPIFYSVISFGVYQALAYVPAISQFSGYLSKIVSSVVVVVWTYAISNMVGLLITEFGRKFAAKAESSLNDELTPLFGKLSRIIIYFVGMMVLLQTWNLDITPLLASAGIAGFIVAFAAQDTISHLFGGVSIYFDKPFKVGDRIQLESGEIGDVLEIGIRSTRIKTLEETVVIMPNSKIASSKIINYNQPELKIKSNVTICVSYDSDVEKVKKILLEIAGGIEDILKNPTPEVYVSELGDYSLKFLVVNWVNSPKKQFSARSKFNEIVVKRFKEEGIQIPYPTEEVRLSR